MNIALTNRCSRRCAFCYQSAVMDQAKARGEEEMPLANFARVLDFIEASGEQKLTLVGGEPTMHRHFDAVLQMIDARAALRQVLLFTNGIFRPSVLEAIIRHRRKLIVCINVLHPSEEHPSARRRLDKTLQGLRAGGVRFDFSYVIYQPDFDAAFLLEKVRRYRVAAVRWALAFPSAPGAAFVTREQLPLVGERIVRLLEDLAAQGVRTYVDCPLPYCIFSDAQLGLISRQALSVINWGYCGLTLEVNPDLTVKACPAQREEERVALTAFADMQALQRYFFTRMSVYKAAHRLYEHCADCRYYLQQRCQGGCLGYSKEAFALLPPAAVATLGNGDIPPGWRVRPLQHLALKDEQGRRVLYSTASAEVCAEALSAQTEAFWRVLAAGPTFGEAAAAFAPAARPRLKEFVRELQRAGLVDLVAEG